MSTQLIAITQGVGDLDGLCAEDVVSYVARVSSPQNQNNLQSAPKLIKYLIDNSHWSPLEHVYATFEIVTSLPIAAQILRHRSFVFQQFSGRYSKHSKYLVYPARRQDTKNRQNSIDDLSQETKDWFDAAQREVGDLALKKYEEALAKGVAKEQCRFLLTSGTETRMYMTGNLRSWVHYVELRKGNGTQAEHALIASEIADKLSQLFPSTAKALGWVD